MADISTLDYEASPTAAQRPAAGKLRRIFRWLGWSTFAIVCLTFFTLVRLPEERIGRWALGQLNWALSLSPQRISVQAEKISWSLLLFPSVDLRAVSISVGQSETPIKFDRIEISPSIIPLLQGRLGATVRMRNGDGKVAYHFWFKPRDPTSPFGLSLQSEQLDFAKLGVLSSLSAATSLQGGGLLDGTVDLTGSLADPTTLKGSVKLKIKNFEMPAQKIMGFGVPKIAISESNLDIGVENSKVTLKNVQLGREGTAADDIHATLSGTIGLVKYLNSSTLNVNAKFRLSDSILKAFILLDAILGSGKQSDGTYAFKIDGTLGSPSPSPAGS